ncbi:MAG: CinA family protein [Eubacterium sp.]|nr:CinA family protein [Eubacterium sp.]
MTLEEELVDLLIKKNYHISFAESCTGGLCAATLVNVANASKVFDMSFVTYANEAKINLLGVSEETIKKHGVVSEEVAREMAQGVAEKAKSEIGVGVSGIAGPSGGTAEKPVGMVCFGFCINGKTITATKQFGEIGRNEVRNSSVRFVYQTLINLIK